MSAAVPTPPPLRRSPKDSSVGGGQQGEDPEASLESSIYSDCYSATSFYDCAATEYNSARHKNVTPEQVSRYMAQNRISPPPPPTDTPFPSLTETPPPPAYPSVTATPTQTTQTPAETSESSSRSSADSSSATSSTKSKPTVNTRTTKTQTRTSDDVDSSQAPSSSSTASPSSTSDDADSASSSNTVLPLSLSNTPDPEVSQFVTTVPSGSTPSTAVSSFASKSHTGAVVGGVIGALLFLVLVAAAVMYFLRRRQRAARPAPSAEFLHMARGGADSPVFVAKGGYTDEMAHTPTDAYFVSLARQSSIEDGGAPPPFTPGNFRDPVLEKVNESASMWDRR